MLKIKDPILIGPIGAGKTTVAALLADRLGVPQVSMDLLRWDYYREIGYDETLAAQVEETEGFWGLYRYWKPFEAYAVERITADHKNCVFDFGAGHSVFEDRNLFHRVHRVLAPYANVCLLLPCPEISEALEILAAREESLRTMRPNINEHFMRHHSNMDLAKHVIYTREMTPAEVCELLFEQINQTNSSMNE